ncbi:MAG: hypothetical protein ACRDJU_14190 [Actinomycetota bacterium]
MTKRWVRYVVPVMVEVDCEADEVNRVVMLPAELREDRDDGGHFLIYTERFVRRHADEQPQLHASCVAEPRWRHPVFRAGSPVNWPDSLDWEHGFDLLTPAGDRYAESNPYDPVRRDRARAPKAQP